MNFDKLPDSLGAAGIIVSLALMVGLAFNPTYFGKWKGDVPFSVYGTNWSGYVRCDNNERNVFAESEGKVAPLEDALQNVPTELGRRDIARDMIMDELSKYKYSCLE
ncbi:hypothetical protein GOV13_04560 [Candidatus Pacearchaeota archaeon]|nr:hypothetical protein [Candidatus Pacearchaeota archaeon]